MDEPSDEQLAGYDEMTAFCDTLVTQRNASEHTVRNYSNDILDYLRWANREEIDPLNITYKQIRGYLGELDRARYARTTINRRLSALRSFFRWLNVTEQIDNDPVSVLQGPKSAKTLPKVIKPADMVRLLNVHNPDSRGDDGTESELAGESDGVKRKSDRHTWQDMRDLALLEFLYACGARVGEASSLLVSDVDFDEKQVKVFGKGSKERIVPLHDLALSSMQRYAIVARPKLLKEKQSDYFFISNCGNKMTTDAIRKMFKETVRAAGLDESLSPHAMRHTFATDMLTGGADLRSVQEMLGHVSLSTTQIYTHVSVERLKKAHAQAHPRAET